ncbi:ABC transporter ATP-binding protein [Rariglobus hedericola]|uniref:ABC transporter ATP-binding protein n=1 Tax=Rariglobus hedericola TaxID=2597822 RepID=A0A556QS79_9BACT|nr:ABC transporter ATP-binding protein [Rariglobus hedericola]TSJ79497.1 ABC transporter ATP-binding protein [Rariglobus hedericola]
MSTPRDRRPLSLVQRAKDDAPEAEVRPLDWGIVRRLFGYTRPFARKRNWLIVLTLLRASQLPALAWMTALIIAGPISKHQLSPLFGWIAAYAVMAVLTDGLFHFRQRFALEIGEMVVGQMRSDIFDHVSRMPMSFFHRVKLGRILSRVTSDVESLRAGIEQVFFVGIVQLGQMVFAAAVMAWTDWVLFLVVLGLAPVLWLLNNHFRVRLSRDTRAQQESFSRVTATLAESINGIRVTQGFVRQTTNAGLFRSLLADHSRYSMGAARSSAILLPLLELNSQFFVAILLMLGGWQVLDGQVEIGVLITFFLFANQFFAPIQVLGNLYNQALVSMAGAERVFQLLDIKPDWEDAPSAVELPDPRVQAKSSADLAKARGARVEFRNVAFGYDAKQRVLHDVSFTAEPGQMIALVGHTGSGKSSIINLVSKFYLPTAGEVLIDGYDIRGITGRSLHRQSGMVQQSNFLFAGSVLDNIRFGRPEATEAEVRAAVEKLGCADMFDSLPQGLATVVSERGGGISAGQRQLVCFARALLADPRLLILDEATSAIDALTEARLQQALVTLLAGRTSFVVAHRLSTIRHADLVLVLDAGRVVERGTHAELLSLKKHYAALHEQFVRMGAA